GLARHAQLRHHGRPGGVAGHGPHARPGFHPHAARPAAPRGRHPAHRAVDPERRGQRLTRPTISLSISMRRFSISMRRLVLPVFAGLLVLALGGGRAQAYPQFQFSSGTNRCSQCHYSPAGGGLITSWGRDESGDTLSLGGDGAFLHGAWSPPSW